MPASSLPKAKQAVSSGWGGESSLSVKLCANDAESIVVPALGAIPHAELAFGDAAAFVSFLLL